MAGRAASEFTVRRASWAGDADALMAVREAVFVVEQGVAPELERDGLDPDCWHALALDGRGGPVGAGRLTRGGKVGRVAVLARWRGCGVGAALMRELLERADAEGLASLYLHSQVEAKGFYERLGFASRGEEFEEAGITHVAMVRER